MKSRYAILAAVLLGLLATVGIKQLIDRKMEQIEAGEREVTILVAARDVPEGTLLRESDLAEVSEKEKYAVGKLTPRDKGGLIGYRTRVMIREGQPLRFEDVEEPTARRVDTLQTGERLFTISVDLFTGVGGLLLAGNYVDVLSILPEETAAGRGPAGPASGGGERAQVILERVKIHSVGPVETTRDGFSFAPRQYSAVTVVVTPLEAELLAYAQSKGRLILVKRSDVDTWIGRERFGDGVGPGNLSEVIKQVNEEKKKR